MSFVISSQFVEGEHFRDRIPEEYILVIETDHMMMKPLENSATPELPIGFGFYYMLGTDPKLKPVVQQFLDPSISPDTVWMRLARARSSFTSPSCASWRARGGICRRGCSTITTRSTSLAGFSRCGGTHCMLIASLIACSRSGDDP